MLKRASAVSFAFSALLCAQNEAPTAPTGLDAALWQRAWKLHHEAVVVDTHTDTTSRILDEGFDMGPRAKDGHMDLPRIREGGLDVAFYSIYVACGQKQSNIARTIGALEIAGALEYTIIFYYL
jgi:hypothetical protein